jgi:hypothetical protein
VTAVHKGINIKGKKRRNGERIAAKWNQLKEKINK